jgi:CO dehydrogenase maturation factor
MCEDCEAHQHHQEHDHDHDYHQKHDHGHGASLHGTDGPTPTIIAVCGKGGVGKTSISAMVTKVLLIKRPGARVLVIDADPAVGLATALGVDVVHTVDEIRNDVIKSSRTGEAGNVAAILEQLDYRVYEAMAERDHFAFLAIGRPETEGCYCKVNDYLKEVIEELVANFDYVVIDGEAGIEQVNRRVLETVTHLLLVSDCSLKGINVIKTIRDVADGGVMHYGRVGALLNRVVDPADAQLVDLGDIDRLACILEDSPIRKLDIAGRSLLGLPDDDPSVVAVAQMLEKFGVLV